VKKQEYLNSLRNYLYQLSSSEVEEIIADYEEHFLCAGEAGKSDEDIVKGLGPAKSLANLYITQSHIEAFHSRKKMSVSHRLNSFIKALFTFLLLAPLNFFLAIGPFLVIFVLLFTSWSVWISFSASSFASYFSFLFIDNDVSMGLFTHLSVFFLWVGSLGACALMGILFYYISKISLMGILSYIKWNINLIVNKTKGSVA